MNVLQFDFGTAILSEYDRDGFLGIAIDHYGDDGAGAPPAEAHHPLGFAARPMDPDQSGPKATVTGGATVLHFFEGQRGHAIALQDHRHPAPRLPKGGSAQYSPGTPVASAAFDQSGNYHLTVPSGTTVLVEIAGGPSVKLSGTTVQVLAAGAVQIGDSTAQPLALGPVLGQLIAALQTFAAGNCPPNAPMTTSVAFIALLQSLTQFQTKIVSGA